MLAYKKLEYIQTSGAQYINTGIAASSNIRWELTIDIIGTATQYQGVWDSLNLCTGWQGGYIFYCNNNIKEYGIKGNGKYKFILQNGYQGYDNTQVSSYGWGGSGYQIFIGRCNANWSGGDLWCTEKIYRSTLYQGDKLVQDLIPVKRLSDNKVCMYDLVTNQFYTGSGTFIAGPEILDIKLLKINGLMQPKVNGKKVYLFNGIQTHYDYNLGSYYTKLNYIESTGTQYIDSLLTMEKSDSVVMEISAKLTNNESFGGVNGYLQYKANVGSGNKGIIKVDYNGTNYVEKIYFEDTLKETNNWSSFSSSNNKIGIIGMGQGNNSWWTNSSRSAQSGQWYYVKIYKNNELVRDFIPTKRNSDNEIGLYDKVTKQFFTNQGTGTFIGG